MAEGDQPTSRYETTLAVVCAAFVASLWLIWVRIFQGSAGDYLELNGHQEPHALLGQSAAAVAALLALEIVLRRTADLGLPTTVAGFGRGQIQLAASVVIVALVFAKYLYLRDSAVWGIYVALALALAGAAAAFQLRPTTPIKPSAFIHGGERVMVSGAAMAFVVAWIPWYFPVGPKGWNHFQNAWREPDPHVSTAATLIAMVLLAEWFIAAYGDPTPRWRQWPAWRHGQLALAVVAAGLVGFKYVENPELRLAGVYLALVAYGLLVLGAGWVWAYGDIGSNRAAEALRFEQWESEPPVTAEDPLAVAAAEVGAAPLEAAAEVAAAAPADPGLAAPVKPPGPPPGLDVADNAEPF